MGKKGLVEIIFVLVIMIVIFIAAYSFLIQFFGATPQQRALNDVKSTIESVCDEGGLDAQSAVIFLPENFKIELTADGYVILQQKITGGLGPIGYVEADSKTLECPDKTFFPSCTIGPAVVGGEDLPFGVNKTVDQKTKEVTIILTDVSCG